VTRFGAPDIARRVDARVEKILHRPPRAAVPADRNRSKTSESPAADSRRAHRFEIG